ncbi:hypothetical protein [Acrocarpospora macrocephala]|uniref:hypothetical protein n=1 Tax=Acrocarpospora macrocephala TaxID=150177 RepID=UPI0012D37178|nr:hypothetical protein [Acrocarpospora macrocephala]
MELSGKSRDSGPDLFTEPSSRGRFGRTALLSGLSVLVAVGVTFAGVRLVGDRTDLVLEPPAASCEPGGCGAAPAVPQPSATDFATPEESPSPTADKPKPKPTPKSTAPAIVQAKPTPSRTNSPKPKKSPTPTATEDDEVPVGIGLEEGGGPSSNDDAPADGNTLRVAAPAVTVAFEVTQEDFDGYAARIVVLSGNEDISDLRLAIPVTGEVLTVEGAQWEVRRGQLILTSFAPLLAGEELVVEMIANGSPTTPSDCVLTGGDCTIAAPPTL